MSSLPARPDERLIVCSRRLAGASPNSARLCSAGRTCRVTSSSRSTAPWCSGTSGSALASTTRTSWYGKPFASSLRLLPQAQSQHFPSTVLFIYIFFLRQPCYSLLFSFFFPPLPAVNPRFPLQGRLRAGSIWRSLCLSWAQLPVCRVYITARLAASSGQSVGGWGGGGGGLIQQPVRRNAVRSPALKSPVFYEH